MSEVMPTGGIAQAPSILPYSMTKAEFRDQFLDWLNRGDISQAQADLLINRALARCNRELRIPAMEKSIVFQSPDGNPFERITLPDNFLQLRDVVADGVPCYPVSYSKLIRLPDYPGRGSVFARDEGTLAFRPLIQTYARILYVASFSPLTADTDTTELLGISPECLLFAALSYAARFFRLDELETWEQSFATERDTLNQMAIDTDTLGVPVSIEPGQSYNYR